MSRGPGVVQREILRRLEKDGLVVVRDMVRAGVFVQPSIHRAMDKLEKAGLIHVWIVWALPNPRYKMDWFEPLLNCGRFAVICPADITTSEQFDELRKVCGIFPN